MSKVLNAAVLFLYNFTTILALKYKDGLFKTSKTLTLLNILKIPITVFFTVFVSTYPPLRDKIFMQNLIILKNYSDFSKLSMILLIVNMYIGSYSICILHFVKVKKIEIFLSSIFAVEIEEELLKTFNRKCFKHFLSLLSVFVFVSSVQVIGSLKLSLSAILADLVFQFPNFVLIGFVMFVKTFENFICLLLHQIKKCIMIQNNQKLTSNMLESYLILSKGHREIWSFVEEFNNNFGAQLTIVICYGTSTMVLNVKL